MSDDPNRVSRALRSTPPDRDLTAVEPLVWRRLDEDAGWAFFGAALSPQASVAAARVSLGALMLMAGLLAGAVGAGWIGTELNELAVFSTDAPFGPSAMLSQP